MSFNSKDILVNLSSMKVDCEVPVRSVQGKK